MVCRGEINEELTYEDWVKNPTDRLMGVWDNDENKKERRKVIYFHGTDMSYPIIALSDDDTDTENFKHCAEIEKQRRMTKKELSRWLREKPTREFKYGNSAFWSVYSTYTYDEVDTDKEVRDDIVIREDDGEWREPLVEEIE